MSRVRSMSASKSVVARGEDVVIGGGVPDPSTIETLAGGARTDAVPTNHAAKSRRYASAGDVRRRSYLTNHDGRLRRLARRH